jgi:hypothetical protein
MVTDVNGTLTDLASLEANALINGAMAYRAISEEGLKPPGPDTRPLTS